MTRLEQLAALVAGMGAPVRHVPSVSPGETEVAQVVKPADGDVLAGFHNAGPALLAIAQAAARFDARARAGKATTLVADRKALIAAFDKFNAA